MSWIKTAVSVGTTLLSGNQQKKAAEAGADANAEANAQIQANKDQARGDILGLFSTSEQNLLKGNQGMLDFAQLASPQQFSTFNQGNLNAQRTLAQTLPQMYNAMMGNPINYNNLQPREVLFDPLLARNEKAMMPDFSSGAATIANNQEGQQTMQPMSLAQQLATGPINPLQKPEDETQPYNYNYNNGVYFGRRGLENR